MTHAALTGCFELCQTLCPLARVVSEQNCIVSMSLNVLLPTVMPVVPAHRGMIQSIAMQKSADARTQP